MGLSLGLGIGLQFVQASVGKREWNFEGGDTGPFASFARSGAGTAFTSAGMIQSFASGVPRVTDKGLLLEGLATNLVALSSPTVAQLSSSTNTFDVTEPDNSPISGRAWLRIGSGAGGAAMAQQTEMTISPSQQLW